MMEINSCAHVTCISPSYYLYTDKWMFILDHTGIHGEEEGITE